MYFYFQSLTDESHSVVKQALISIESLFPLLLVHLPGGAQSGSKRIPPRRPFRVRRLCAQVAKEMSQEYHSEKTDSQSHVFDEVTIAQILGQIQLVFANKYWVVQCKYCELIACLNFDEIEWHVGEDERQVVQVSSKYKYRNNSMHECGEK